MVDEVERDRQIWTHIFAKQLRVDSIIPPINEFVNQNFAHPMSTRVAQITSFKESIMGRVREFKRVPPTPKRKKLERDGLRNTLEEFIASMNQLNLDDSEVDEIAQYPNPAPPKSPSRTPDLDVMDKKKSASVMPASVTPKMPKSAVRASRIRVASATRTPVTRSVTRHLREMSSPAVMSENTTPKRDRTTNEKRLLTEQCALKLECASATRDERLREEVERKRRDREERERRVQLNRQEKERLAKEKLEAARKREQLVEQHRLEQLTATKRAASKSPGRRPPLPSHSSVSTTTSTTSGQSGIPRLLRPTEASTARAGRQAKEKGLNARRIVEASPAHKSTAAERKKAAAERKAAAKLAKEEAARKNAEEEEAERRAAEEAEARKRAALEERKRAYAEAKRLQEERQRLEAEAEQRMLEEEETRRRLAEEEQYHCPLNAQEDRFGSDHKTPAHQPLRSKNTPTEYKMTPDKEPKPSTATNYNIDDLSSADETDDDENPRKQVPSWAERDEIIKAARRQAELDPRFADRLFPPLVLPDLQSIFTAKMSSRYTKRTSSAVWNSPLEQPTVGKSRFPAHRHKRMKQAHY